MSLMPISAPSARRGKRRSLGEATTRPVSQPGGDVVPAPGDIDDHRHWQPKTSSQVSAHRPHCGDFFSFLIVAGAQGTFPVPHMLLIADADCRTALPRARSWLVHPSTNSAKVAERHDRGDGDEVGMSASVEIGLEVL